MHDKTPGNSIPGGSKTKALLSKKQMILIFLTTMTVLTAIALAVAITLYCFHHRKHIHGVPKSPDIAEMYEHAAVAADAVTCSEIGRDILIRNGSAVDAAVAALFCLGLFSMHSTGVGGGGLMVVYTRRTKTVETYDYRESAPGKSREDMYMDDFNKSRIGGLAIAVPGEIKGLHEVWKQHGRLPWRELIEPTINLTLEGFAVPQRLHEAANSYRHLIEKDPGLRELFIRDGRVIDLGTKITSPPLARTLRKIQDNPEDFYTGGLAEDIVKDIQDAGGIITLDDLANYKVVKRKALVDDIGDLTMYTMPAPTGGPTMTHIMNILKGYSFIPDDINDENKATLTYHRIIEALKFGYASRTQLGDPDYLDREKMDKMMEDMTSPKYGSAVRQKITDYQTHDVSYYGAEVSPPVDKGTTHISIYAPNGDAVSATHTINEWFGSTYRSPTTGILYNNEMDDFSTPGVSSRFGFPPSSANYIRPGKRPVSSMGPFIIVDRNGDVRMVLGGSGGTKIISATVFVLMYKFWFNDELGHAISRPRLHHQLVPTDVFLEIRRPLPLTVQDGLRRIGHNITFSDRPEFSAVQAVYIEGAGKIYAKSDPRKYGHSAGY